SMAPASYLKPPMSAASTGHGWARKESRRRSKRERAQRQKASVTEAARVTALASVRQRVLAARAAATRAFVEIFFYCDCIIYYQKKHAASPVNRLGRRPATTLTWVAGRPSTSCSSEHAAARAHRGGEGREHNSAAVVRRRRVHVEDLALVLVVL